MKASICACACDASPKRAACASPQVSLCESAVGGFCAGGKPPTISCATAAACEEGMDACCTPSPSASALILTAGRRDSLSLHVGLLPPLRAGCSVTRPPVLNQPPQRLDRQVWLRLSWQRAPSSPSASLLATKQKLEEPFCPSVVYLEKMKCVYYMTALQYLALMYFFYSSSTSLFTGPIYQKRTSSRGPLI